MEDFSQYMLEARQSRKHIRESIERALTSNDPRTVLALRGLLMSLIQVYLDPCPVGRVVSEIRSAIDELLERTWTGG